MKKLVVIDDEFDFCTLVKLYCSKCGIECRYANNLAEGINLVNEFKPDIVILDNNLPDGYGWVQTDYLLHAYPLITINLITAKNDFECNSSEYENKDIRVSRYLKPLSLTQLNKIIHQHAV